MDVVALDLSLSATGFAHGTASGVLHSRYVGVERLVDLRDRIAGVCDSADLCLIEGYSYNSRQGGERLGELGGVVRVMLHESAIPVIEIPPATLKVFGTGKGNASKNEMLAEAVRRLGYPGHDHNEVDAIFLRLMALVAYGRCDVEFPKTHLRAVEKIAWPELVA